ncbi:hypothetical protein [Runella slithyformis]|uniref:Uncharacterized protein n=1 Tax=Runella slithyformis (strain ATCC 29530 / DSM 19594 / LMG 11500 / NCIMB 11436 / LSU 4) TaxID=761193 RepID=A0A7U3ZHM6_RUNSL|nr:hypothetical protein [Runella slithyformis]AEI47317.1 hypothetical protein Runsl_0880 [Runella slithyformis DSM 19594]
MKSFIATAALSLLALSTIAEAQPQKEQSLVAAHLMATLPTQDVETITPAFASINIPSLLASLPTVDVAVEVPTTRVNVVALMASLPTVDENTEAPASRVNATQLMASLPTVDETSALPTVRFSASKLMASLPIMDETTVTSVLVDTNTNHSDSKDHQTSTRLTEE